MAEPMAPHRTTSTLPSQTTQGSEMAPERQGTGTVAHGPPATGSTMQAIVQDAYGSADVLRLASISPPEIAASEVLLRVHAAGLDRGAWHLMTGRPYLLRLVFGIGKPKNPVRGREVAGTVVAVGPAVTRYSAGDEVYGIGRGTFAEYAAAAEDKLARKPANVTFEQAAVAPVSGLTALQALTDVGRVKHGDKVLVIGASGGVGSHAVQLAKGLGAEVTGVCSTAKLDLVRSLGADHVIDYTTGDFADAAQRYDLILDIAGNRAPSRLRRALTPTGTAVMVGGEEGGSLTGGMGRQLRARALSLVVRQRLTAVMCRERSADLDRLTEFIEAGTLTPSIDRTYSLDQVPQAMRHLAAGKARGKVAITMPDGQSLITAFWNTVAPNYETPDNVAPVGTPGYAAWVEALRSVLPASPARVLDVGTGTGFVASICAELGHQVTAIDLSEGMLEASPARDCGLAITFAVGDAVDPPFPPRSFDVVVSRSVLWTLRQPELAFRNWYELLAPGGRMVAIYGLSAAARSEPPSDADAEDSGQQPTLFERHYTPQTRQELTAMHLADHELLITAAAAAGFRDVTVIPLEMVRGWETSPGSDLPYALSATRPHGSPPRPRPGPA
jgi:NADPH:quinone reductase-like Zn-dependent oxidoreductase/SAM-dependent methyltransferase